MPDPTEQPESASPTEEVAERASNPSESTEELRRQRDDYLEQLQRSRAEFANYQKRARMQADADRQFAVAGLAADLLAVLDNLERAIGAARVSGDGRIVDGLDLVHKQFLDTLSKHGVEPIAALGQPFDPNLHEALTQQVDPTQPENTVVAELTKGYRLRDRVLRPTRVTVSSVG